PLALEDAYKQHQRPKVDTYPDFLFIVAYSLAIASQEAGECDVRLDEIAIFFGANYLVTVHRGPLRVLDEAAGRWREVRSRLGDNVAALLYALLDSVVDDYFPAIDTLTDVLDSIEEQMIDHFDRSVSLRLLALRRHLITVRRVLAPERDALNALMRHDGELLPRNVEPYIMDVYDHLLRVLDTVDTTREQLAGDLDVYMSALSNNLNQVMKTLTAISAVLMTAGLVTGFYGMNVAYPGRDTDAGFWWSAALIVVPAAVLAGLFKRLGWF
ncbi:MAG: magnesium transporter CorA family protein, partial [Chloroflexi bacterium]|nr:magnesium transporter CorA family protein [Chloroflexota bacterium]